MARAAQLPRCVIKAGQIVAEEGDIRAASQDSSHAGQTMCVEANYDRAVTPHIHDWIDENYSIRASNYAIDADELPRVDTVRCG